MEVSYQQRIENLRDNYINITKNEYQCHGVPWKEKTFEPSIESLELMKNKTKEQSNFELDKMYNKINNISKKMHSRKKGQIKEIESINPLTQSLISDPEIFNIVTQDKEYKDWKQLTIEEKIEKATEFLNSTHHLEEGNPPYTESIKLKIFDLINEKKLYLKKDIEYDKINQRIAIIPLIKYDIEMDEYILKSTEKKKNVKKLSQNAVQKLMKKSRN